MGASHSAVRHDLTKRLVRTCITHASHKIEMKKRKQKLAKKPFIHYPTTLLTDSVATATSNTDWTANNTAYQHGQLQSKNAAYQRHTKERSHSLAATKDLNLLTITIKALLSTETKNRFAQSAQVRKEFKPSRKSLHSALSEKSENSVLYRKRVCFRLEEAQRKEPRSYCLFITVIYSKASLRTFNRKSMERDLWRFLALELKRSLSAKGFDLIFLLL